MATATDTQTRQLSQVKEPSRIEIEVSDETAVTANAEELGFDTDDND